MLRPKRYVANRYATNIPILKYKARANLILRKNMMKNNEIDQMTIKIKGRNICVLKSKVALMLRPKLRSNSHCSQSTTLNR